MPSLSLCWRCRAGSAPAHGTEGGASVPRAPRTCRSSGAWNTPSCTSPASSTCSSTSVSSSSASPRASTPPCSCSSSPTASSPTPRVTTGRSWPTISPSPSPSPPPSSSSSACRLGLFPPPLSPPVRAPRGHPLTLPPPPLPPPDRLGYGFLDGHQPLLHLGQPGRLLRHSLRHAQRRPLPDVPQSVPLRG